MENEYAFIGCPNYGSLVPETVQALLGASRDGTRTIIRFQRSSLLALNCNVLWAEALNARHLGLTHFVMLHADVAPADPDWLTRLLDEQRRSGADILSVAMPVKDDRGVSSTAVADPETHHLVRLTMRQLSDLPPTFDAGGAGFPGRILLVNTGCFVCDFRHVWADQLYFSMDDHIVRCQETGRYEALNVPEDWAFSLRAHRLGLRVMVTRELAAVHFGRKGYHNDAIWGAVRDPNNEPLAS